MITRVGHPPVLVASHGLWQDLGSDPELVGKTLYFDRRHWTVIGVAEPHPGVDRETFWAPFSRPAPDAARDVSAPLQVLAIRRPEANLSQANADVARLSTVGGSDQSRDLYAGLGGLEVVPAKAGLVRGEVEHFYRLMLALSILVLVCACANVANILLARAIERTPEIAVRAALGATRWHLIRQVAGEALPIGAMAAAVGLIAAFVLADVAALQSQWTPLPPWVSFDLNWQIAVAVMALSVIASGAAAFIPALRISRVDVQAELKADSRTASRGRTARVSSMMLVFQVGISGSVLLVSLAALLTVGQRASRTLRVDPARYISAGLVFPRDEFPADARVHELVQTLDQKLAGLTGGVSGAVSTRSGLSQGQEVLVQFPGDLPGHGRPAYHAAIGSSYLQVLDTPILEGRGFRPSDDRKSMPVAIVDTNFVRRFWTTGPVLDRTFFVVRRNGRRQEFRVVGVIPSLHMGGASNADSERAGLFVPLAQLEGRAAVHPFVTGYGGPAVLQQRLMEVIRAVDSERPPRRMWTFQAQLDEENSGLRSLGRLYGLFGLAALVVSVVGLYGLTSLTVRQRTREIGTRIALGATTSRVLTMFLRRCAVLVAAGLTVGAAMGAVLLTLSERRLGPLTGGFGAYGFVALVLGGCAFVATVIPALRAARVSPMVMISRG
jgi:putative ABC transport system permease protein